MVGLSSFLRSYLSINLPFYSTKGEKDNGWDKLKQVISSILVAPTKMTVYKEIQCPSSKRLFYGKVGPLNWPYVKVVKEEGASKGGLVPIGRQRRAMM